MPVGGSHRGIWKSSGGSSTTDNFDRANGALGSTQTGDILPWQEIVGTWSITTNRPTTGTAASSNPLAVIDSGSPDVDVSLNVSTGGGDALYFRVSDASNWWRLRSDNYTYSYTYSYSCQYTYSYTCYSQSSYTCYQTQYCQTTVYNCAWNYGGGNPHNHLTYTCSGSSYCCTGSVYHSHSGNTANHIHYGYGSVSYTYSTACGSQAVTCYSQVSNTCYATAFTTCYATAYAQEISSKVEKAVAGTITEAASYTADPTSFRALAVGSSITPYVNGAAQAALTDTNHTGATKHGFGKGASGNLGTAIDNFSLTDKS